MIEWILYLILSFIFMLLILIDHNFSIDTKTDKFIGILLLILSPILSFCLSLKIFEKYIRNFLDDII